jgi:pyruvate/2-oxoglutarate dehydrogenase complex dihydrolipoamide dehydrogenase (E3) component
LELAGEIAAVWPDKHIVLVDLADQILPGPYDQRLRDELNVSSTTWESSESWAAHSPNHLPDTPAGEARTFTVATPTPTGTRVEADIWFRCHGTTPATGYLADELAAARTPDGYLEVTPQLQVVGFDRVYALGDIAAIDTNKAGVAGRQAVVVVTNIRAQLDGTDERAAYTPGPPAIILRWDPPEARDSSPPRTTSPPPSSSRRSRGRTDDRPVHRAPQRPGGGGECQDNGCSLIDHGHAVT